MKDGLPAWADEHILLALREDMPNGDISVRCLADASRRAQVGLICKQNGVVAGLEVFARVFELLDPSAETDFLVEEGDGVRAGQIVAVVRGQAGALLSGERTALNYLQRMSGIATCTRKAVRLLEGTGVRLLDTRKTTPCMRLFEKQAVLAGGGSNHRFGLSDGIMLKDNHIALAGGIRQAVEAARRSAPPVLSVEVEVETLDQVREALEAGADTIMLDNMSLEQMASAVSLIGRKAKIECSGNVTTERIPELVRLGVDFISCGALTHSAGVLDFSMKGFKVIG